MGIGLRYPKNKIALALVKLLGRPITATSANLTGFPETYTMVEARRQFASSKVRPDYYLDGGRLANAKPSTIVALAAGHVKILRPGPISEKQIKEALK